MNKGPSDARVFPPPHLSRYSILGSAGTAILTVVTSVVSPLLLSRFLDGPEGTRWLVPLVVALGSATALYILIFPWVLNVTGSRESTVALGVAALFMTTMTFIAVQRMSSGLRVYETFNALMAQRLAAGQSLYNNPESAPLGSIYPPLYYLLSGIVFRLFPDFLTNGRLLSLLSTMGTAVLVHRIVQRMNGTPSASAWAVALFGATYGILTTCYDNVAVDPLSMFLVAAALFYFVKGTPRDDAAALFTAGVACFTKQSAVFPFLVVLVTIVVSRRKLWVFWPLLFWGAVGAVMLWMTRGRVWEYLVIYPSGHPWRSALEPRIIRAFFVLQLPLWFFFVAGLPKPENRRFAFYACSVLVASLLGVYKAGGWLDALDPFEPLLCIGAAAGLGRWKPLLIIQLLAGLYNPFGAIYPWSTIREADRQTTHLIESTAGEVWAPAETHLSVAAGKREWDHLAGLESANWGGTPPPGRLVDAIENRTFDLIILRPASAPLFLLAPSEVHQAFDKHYEKGKHGLLIVYRPRPTPP